MRAEKTVAVLAVGAILGFGACERYVLRCMHADKL